MEEIQSHIYVLILAGGGGTRLWPQSRENSPKQFMQLFSGKSLLELTVERAKKITSPSNIFICTSIKYQSIASRRAPGIPKDNIIYEPMRRDTALALGIGAAIIAAKDPQAVIVNFPSDHLVKPLNTYTSEIKKAAAISYKTNSYVVVGVRPRYPHSGYGQIQTTGALQENGSLIGKKFIEKPPLELAQQYTKDPNYYWNVGQYIWPAQLFLNLLKKHAPKTYVALPRIALSYGTDKENQVIQHAYQMAPTISVDYAVSEKLNKFTLFPGSFFWTDVGDWKEVWKNLEQDELGNVIEGPLGKGEYIGVNSKNNLLFIDKQLVATVGLENMLVVDTPDALLICPKDDAQAVKKVVEILKEQKLTKYL